MAKGKFGQVSTILVVVTLFSSPRPQASLPQHAVLGTKKRGFKFKASPGEACSHTGVAFFQPLAGYFQTEALL